MSGSGERAEDAGGSAQRHQRFAGGQCFGLEGGDLRPVHANHEHSGDEGPENLGEDVVGHFPPREALPEGEADRDGGVEVASGRRSAGDDGEGDANPEGPADLEKRAVGRDANGLSGVEKEGRCCCYAGETGGGEGWSVLGSCNGHISDKCMKYSHIEKDSCGFRHAFSQDTGPVMLCVSGVIFANGPSSGMGRPSPYRLCSKSSFRCDTGLVATTWRDICFCTASVAPSSTVSPSASPIYPAYPIHEEVHSQSWVCNRSRWSEVVMVVVSVYSTGLGLVRRKGYSQIVRDENKQRNNRSNMKTGAARRSCKRRGWFSKL